jgi:hypothetical protein
MAIGGRQHPAGRATVDCTARSLIAPGHTHDSNSTYLHLSGAYPFVMMNGIIRNGGNTTDCSGKLIYTSLCESRVRVRFGLSLCAQDVFDIPVKVTETYTIGFISFLTALKLIAPAIHSHFPFSVWAHCRSLCAVTSHISPSNIT